MKHLRILILLAPLFIFGCKPFEATQVQVKESPISPKLLTLEKKVEDVVNAVIVVSADEMKLFTQEAEKNLMDPYGDKFGTLEMKKSTLKLKTGYGYMLVGSLLVGLPYAFGWPMGRFYYQIEVELRILDSNNKLLGKYSAIGESKVFMAAYWGYGNGAIRKLQTDAFNDVFAKIRPQIQADVDRLNAKLLEAGKAR